jgi:hypothetical protein
MPYNMKLARCVRSPDEFGILWQAQRFTVCPL